MACTWSSLAPSGGLGTDHPTTLQSVGRPEKAAAVCTMTHRLDTNLIAFELNIAFVVQTRVTRDLIRSNPNHVCARATQVVSCGFRNTNIRFNEECIHERHGKVTILLVMKATIDVRNN